jgi:hypothetical protein
MTTFIDKEEKLFQESYSVCELIYFSFLIRHNVNNISSYCNGKNHS